MSSSSNHHADGNDSPFRHYFCNQCLNNITLNPSRTSSLHCPVCPHNLTQRFENPTSFRHPINPDAEPFISREAMLEYRHPDNDYIYVITESNFFASPYPHSMPFFTTLPTDGSAIPFLSLYQYMYHCLNEGAIINAFSWSSIKWLPDVKMTEDVIASNRAQCNVCRKAFKIGDEAKQLPCRHLYHYDCIFSRIENRAACPICELPLMSEKRISSVTSGGIRGSVEQIFAVFRANNISTIFEIELRWPINSRFPRFNENLEGSDSNEV